METVSRLIGGARPGRAALPACKRPPSGVMVSLCREPASILLLPCLKQQLQAPIRPLPRRKDVGHARCIVGGGQRSDGGGDECPRHPSVRNTRGTRFVLIWMLWQTVRIPALPEHARFVCQRNINWLCPEVNGPEIGGSSGHHIPHPPPSRSCILRSSGRSRRGTRTLKWI